MKIAVNKNMNIIRKYAQRFKILRIIDINCNISHEVIFLVFFYIFPYFYYSHNHLHIIHKLNYHFLKQCLRFTYTHP